MSRKSPASEDGEYENETDDAIISSSELHTQSSSADSEPIVQRRQHQPRQDRRVFDEIAEVSDDARGSRRTKKRRHKSSRHDGNPFVYEQVTKWSKARLQAWQNRHSNPNAFYYRFTDPNKKQHMSTWTAEEHELFMARVREFQANKWHIGNAWGIFSLALPHRVGYQCSNYYRKQLQEGLLEDASYGYDERGQFRQLHVDTATIDETCVAESEHRLSEVWQSDEVREIEANVNMWIKESFPGFDTGKSFIEVHPHAVSVRRAPRQSFHRVRKHPRTTTDVMDTLASSSDDEIMTLAAAATRKTDAHDIGGDVSPIIADMPQHTTRSSMSYMLLSSSDDENTTRHQHGSDSPVISDMPARTYASRRLPRIASRTHQTNISTSSPATSPSHYTTFVADSDSDDFVKITSSRPRRRGRLRLSLHGQPRDIVLPSSARTLAHLPRNGMHLRRCTSQLTYISLQEIQ